MDSNDVSMSSCGSAQCASDIDSLLEKLADAQYRINSLTDQLIEKEEEVDKYKSLLKTARAETKAALKEIKVRAIICVSMNFEWVNGRACF